MARPKEGLYSLPDGWYNNIISLYMQGASDVEVKSWIALNRITKSKRYCMSNDLWDRWLIEEPEFSETIKMGRILSEAWWTSIGRQNLSSKDFNYTGWYMNMKNRFNWKDKSEHEVTGDSLTINLVKGGG